MCGRAAQRILLTDDVNRKGIKAGFSVMRPITHSKGLEEELVYPSASECGVEVPIWHLAGAWRAQNKSRPDTAKASAILVQDDGCGAAGVPILGSLFQFGVGIGAALVKP